MDGAKKYRSLPVEIEAVKLVRRFDWPDWFGNKVKKNEIITHGLGKFGHGEIYCEIKTLEGVMRANDGDYIILGTEGEVYPCKPSVFENKYVEVQ